MDLSRRVFTKLFGAVGLAGIATYAEPFRLLAANGRDWVEEHEDFYIVRVPAGKTFTREKLGKNTIFQLGLGATISQVEVVGFTNLYGTGRNLVDHCVFDAGGVRSEKPREAVYVGALNNSMIQHCQIYIGPPMIQNPPPGNRIYYRAGEHYNDGPITLPNMVLKV